MSFKVKNKTTKKNVDTRITLDAKHNEKIQKINDKQDIINSKKMELDQLKKQLTKFQQTNYKKNIEKIIDIKDKIISIEKYLSSSNKNEDINYLLDTGHLLFNYYDTVENKDNKIINNIKKPKINIKSVSEYFNINIEYACVSKAQLYDKYLTKLNNTNFKNLTNTNIDICITCNKEKKLFLSEGKMICEICGDENKILIDSDKPSYKDPPREISYFAYKRINHFNEWLAQFQAKESTDIPKEIYDEILIELKKERILNVNTLSQKKLREILKKLKKNKYYEHIPHIINKLNGIPPPIMTRKTEEELRRMFKEIQIPFQNHCPSDRKNFLSYSYILHKFVQLLELDEFIPCFVLLKSREKLHQQDVIWKKICEELKWEFIASI
jgi:hypothetical protein